MRVPEPQQESSARGKADVNDVVKMKMQVKRKTFVSRPLCSYLSAWNRQATLCHTQKRTERSMLFFTPMMGKLK